jgi:hypothetical protein
MPEVKTGLAFTTATGCAGATTTHGHATARSMGCGLMYKICCLSHCDKMHIVLQI